MLTGICGREQSMETQQQQFTERDLEVAQLLLEGKSNKQIALQLGISTRAVEQHLTHIYGKLGVCSRTAAALKLIRLLGRKRPSGFRS
jgi:DNA-binding NarL/FixJ family response regulator